jgi:hypothetical protein
MDQVPRLIVLLTLLAIAAGACSAGNAAGSPTAARNPDVSTPRPRATSSSSAGPSSPGILELTGGDISGFLSVLAVSCSLPGQGVTISIRGRVENKLYDVQVSAPASGAYQLASSAATVQLSSQTPDSATVSRWAGGQGEAGSSGSISIGDDRGGSIDAGLLGIAGTRGSVHLRGSWSCSS